MVQRRIGYFVNNMQLFFGYYFDAFDGMQIDWEQNGTIKYDNCLYINKNPLFSRNTILVFIQ